MTGGSSSTWTCARGTSVRDRGADVFGFDEDADQVVVLDEHPDESLRAAGRRTPCSTARPWP